MAVYLVRRTHGCLSMVLDYISLIFMELILFNKNMRQFGVAHEI